MFERKQKRSEWMEGLLTAELYIQEGYIPDDNLTFWNKDRTFSMGFAYFMYEANRGVCDYLEHYENILQKL